MFSTVEGSSGKNYEAMVEVNPGHVEQINFPDKHSSSGQQRLFTQETSEPAEIYSSFSHSNLAARATVPIMLAHIHKQLQRSGHDLPMRAPTSLSTHSAPLVRRGVRAGLIMPPDYDGNADFTPEDIEASEDNDDGILVTNAHDWNDGVYEWGINSRYGQTRSPFYTNDHKVVPEHEISQTREDLRKMLNPNRQPKKRKATAVSTPHEQLRFDFGGSQT
jgi:hypothetical protein